MIDQNLPNGVYHLYYPPETDRTKPFLVELSGLPGDKSIGFSAYDGGHLRDLDKIPEGSVLKAVNVYETQQTSIIPGQECICPKGLGRVLGYLNDNPHSWIKIKLYTEDEEVCFSKQNVKLIDPRK